MGTFVKLIALFLLIIFGFPTLLAQENESEVKEGHHCLMDETSFSIGIAPQYALHLNSIGSHSRFYYNVGERFCFCPEVSYFDNVKAPLLDLDFVAHYIFETKGMSMYPFVGLNYAIETLENETGNKLGVAFGVGIHRNFRSLNAFAETTRVENKIDDWLFTLGFTNCLKI